MVGRDVSNRRVPARGSYRADETGDIGITGAVVLVLLGVLTTLYVVGFTVAILRHEEPAIALHAVLPVIGGGITYLMRKVWR